MPQQSSLSDRFKRPYQSIQTRPNHSIFNGHYTTVDCPECHRIMVPRVVDGLVRRKISQTNFDYPSPMTHRYSLYLILGALYLLLVSLTLPFPIPPQSLPLGALILSWAMNVLLANTQKRI